MAQQQSAELRVTQANTQFSSQLYQELSKTAGNVFFSPISVHAVLSMAYQGALGTTAEQFAKTLNVPDARTAAEGYNAVMTRLNSIKDVTLLMANKVYLEHKQTLLEDFKTSVLKKFLSEVELVDFVKNEEAARTINTWVEDKTNNKIKDLISKDVLGEATRLVLVNAIYFKGNWLNKFDKADTITEKFFLNKDETVDVEMMHTEEKFNYKEAKELQAQVLEMPYTNEDLSMIIVLPFKSSDISTVEKKLAKISFEDVVKDMYKEKVNVSLPKFKIEQTIDLEDTLTNIGLGEIFDPKKANFRGMITLQPDENLYVSKVVQKAFIEVNEEGAEAAAATALVMVGYSMPPPVSQFRADHPFVYYLVEKNNVLFSGRISKPSSIKA